MPHCGDSEKARRYVERYSTFGIIRETQSKTTMRYHLTLVRMAVTKRTQITYAGKDAEKRGPSYPVGENTNWHSTVVNSRQVSQKT